MTKRNRHFGYGNRVQGPFENYKEMGKKEIIILGAIGNTPRQNRDNMRILSGGEVPSTR